MAGSLALEAGTPVTRIAEGVGASVKVIEDRYRHALPQCDAVAMKQRMALGEVRGGIAARLR